MERMEADKVVGRLIWKIIKYLHFTFTKSTPEKNIYDENDENKILFAMRVISAIVLIILLALSVAELIK